MKRKIKEIFKAIRAKKQKVIKVKIEDCRHYCGFIYGCNSVNNPYQDYIVGLQIAENKTALRNKFIDFLSLYKPQYISDALDIPLSRNYPLWTFPWMKYTTESFSSTTNWHDDPFDVPDIITHFSDKGVLQFRIEEEFVWMEKALASVKKYGYAPKKFNNYVTVWQFITTNQKSVYLLLDGNHRASALYAIGIKSLDCILEHVFYEKDIASWAAVKDTFFSIEDAKAIFYAYINGNTKNYYDKIIEKKILIIE